MTPGAHFRRVRIPEEGYKCRQPVLRWRRAEASSYGGITPSGMSHHKAYSNGWPCDAMHFAVMVIISTQTRAVASSSSGQSAGY